MKPNARCSPGGKALALAAAVLVVSLPAGQGAEDVLKKTFAVEPGSKLVMDVDRGSIDITTADRNEVQIEVRRTLQKVSDAKAADTFKRHEVTLAQEGKEVRIQAELKKAGWSLSSTDSKLQVRFLVSVPPQFNLDVRTSAGGITIADLTGEVKARSSAGTLKLGVIEGPVQATTSAGDIHVARAKTATLHTSAGTIDIDEAIGPVEAVSRAGAIHAVLKGQPQGDCRLETHAGDIRLTVPEGVAVDLEASTNAGHINTQLPVTVEGRYARRSLAGKVNGGGPKVVLHTNAGGIDVLKRGKLAAERE